MRITDFIFFGIILLVILSVLIMVIFNVTIHECYKFWWCLLLPVVIIKIFFKNSKIYNWLEKIRW